MKLKYYFSLSILLMLNFNLTFAEKQKNKIVTKEQSISIKNIESNVNNINLDAKEFNLHDILSIAYLNSNQFKANIANYKAEMHKGIGEISSLFLPSINARVAFQNGKNDSSTTSLSDINLNNSPNNEVYRAAELTINQSIFNFGQDTLRAKATYNKILARQADFYIQEQKLINDIINKFIEFQINKELYEASKVSLENNMAIYKAEEAKYKLGYTTLSDLKTAESRYYNSVADENQKQMLYERSIVDLNFFTNIKNFKNKKLILNKLPLDKKLNLEKLKEKVLNNNYEIIKAKYSLLASKNDAHSAVTGLLPNISGQLTAQEIDYTLNNQFSKSLKAGLIINIPIFNGGREYAGIRSAKSQAASARYSEFDIKNSQLNNTEILINQFNSLQLQYNSAEFSYKAAKISSKSAEEKYKLGQSSFIDFVVTQESEYKRQQELISIKKSLLTTWYQILFIQGQLTAAKLKLNAKIFKPNVELKKNSILLIGF
ncbi:MAG: TolC family protein [Rickettsiales bacterium]